MAVAGLHNLSALGPFFRESQSTVSRQWSDEPATPRTPASSLLQMWRELEGDHVVSHSHRSRGRRVASDSQSLGTSTSVAQRSDNGHDISEDADYTETQAITGSEIDHDDDNSIISEQSSDSGEVERERVRQISQEWMNSGSMGHSSNGFHLNNRSGPQLLGENECERVRVIRDWVHMNAHQRNNQALVREGGSEPGSQIEQVRERLVVTHPEIIARRPIRRLCGRQTLLDLLQRAQCERKEELQGLLEHRPVSDFTHRNRIQALLRGRFLRNERMIPDIRPSSVAATELGMLRQRHTVSGLREGFLSKLERSASTSANSADSDSWSSDQSHSELDSTFQEREMARNSATSDFESDADRNRSQHEFEEVTEEDDTILHIAGNQQDVSSGNVLDVSSYISDSLQDASVEVTSVHTSEGQVLDIEATEEVSTADGADNGHREEINATVTNELLLETEDITFRTPIDAFHDNFESRSDINFVHESAAHIIDLEGNTGEQFDMRDASAQVVGFQDSTTDIEQRAWQPQATVALTEWVDMSGESMARSWQESSGNEFFQETSNNNAAEQDQMQESHEDWPSHDLQEAIDSWLGMPSGEVGAAVGRLDAFYYSDDDNVHNIELRELFSRRRVSGLLRSGFRESLDQVLQSHVERLGHASGDWDLDNRSSPSLVEQDQRQPNGGRALDHSEAAERNPFAPTSPFVIAPQSLWDEAVQGASLPHIHLSQHFGTEWEMVNELRNDMARLQQRLDNMQSMLEQCMDMQIELQRSVRQEVSAALNRSILTKGASKRIALHDESQWDYVRKGICCLCHDSNIDTLLYRCGHMCTCSKCAKTLIQGTGKCPMCQAPVVEALRAYFIQ